jgi:hypothetical protein
MALLWLVREFQLEWAVCGGTYNQSFYRSFAGHDHKRRVEKKKTFNLLIEIGIPKAFVHFDMPALKPLLAFFPQQRNATMTVKDL